MIFELRLDTKDAGDLAVLQFLFNHLKVDVEAVEGAETPPAEPSAKGKKGRGKAKPKGLTDEEIKELDFEGMSAHLLHKKTAPTEFEVKWFAKQFKTKHGQQDDIRAIINELGAHNFTDLKKADFKKFCNLLAEKDAELTSDAGEGGTDDDDLNI